MVIKELYIKNFGKLQEQHFYLRDGIQVITGENEFGKSTLHAFIRAMLFGLERGRGRAAAKDDFTRYEPWESPGHYAGVMRFSCGSRNFRLERSFDRFTKRAVLVCEDDGEELSVDRGDLDMLLGGLTPGVFDSTVSIGQLQAETGQELYDALENHAVNFFETGSGEIDLAGAFRSLKEKKRDTSRTLREEDARQEAEREKLLQESRYLEHDIRKLRAEYAEKREMADACGGRKEEKEDDGQTPGGKSLIWMGIAGLLAGTAGFLWSFFLSSRGQDLRITPFAVIAGVAALIGIALLAAGIAACSKERRAAAGKAKKADGDEAKRLRWEMEHIRAEWKDKEIRCENLKEQWAEFEMSDAQKKLRQTLRALEMAEKALEEAARETGNAGTQAMKKRASEIFSEITSEAYRGIEMDGGGRMSVWDGSRKIPADRLSRGTIEQIYLAVRLAASEILLEEPVPLIFDDAFAFYDDKRLESALKWLSRQGKQVIIFTCQKREEEIVKRFVYS